MPDYITVAALAAGLSLSPSAVRLRAAKLGIEKISDRLYLFTPEQAELIRQAKSTPGKTPLPENEVTRSALSKRRRRAREKKHIRSLPDSEIEAIDEQILTILLAKQ